MLPIANASAWCVYVDFDDVLCETARDMTRLLFELHGRRIRYEDIHAFDLKQSFRLDEVAYADFMAAAHKPEFLQSLRPTAGSAEGLKGWLREGIEPVIVTGRPVSTHEASRRWLDRQGLGGIPLLFVNKYNRNMGIPETSYPGTGEPVLTVEMLIRQPFRVVIDDSPVALDLLLRIDRWQTIIFDRPWNRRYGNDAAHVSRCRDWRELDERVRRLHDLDTGNRTPCT